MGVLDNAKPYVEFLGMKHHTDQCPIQNTSFSLWLHTVKKSFKHKFLGVELHTGQHPVNKIVLMTKNPNPMTRRVKCRLTSLQAKL